MRKSFTTAIPLFAALTLFTLSTTAVFWQLTPVQETVQVEDLQVDRTVVDVGSTATFDLGTFTGEVRVSASAPGRYQNQTRSNC